MDPATHQHFREPRGLAALGFGVLGGPIAWAVQFHVSYFATPYLCGSGLGWLPLAVSAAALVVVALALRAAWRSWARIGRPHETEGSQVEGRTRMLAVGGLGVSAFFLVVIVAGAIPALLLDACRE